MMSALMSFHRLIDCRFACMLAVLALTLLSPSGLTWADHHQQDDASAEAHDSKKKDKADSKKDKDDGDDDEPKVSITEHEVVIDGQTIQYTATAGKILQKTDGGKTKAEFFFIAYTKNDEDAKQRPITFCYNGGPGSASVWLHLGALGPKRVKVDSDAEPLPPPHELLDNEYSPLDLTDLVFIDPVSTGFSRPAEGEDKKQFHGYDEDVNSVAQFIHDYTTKYGRWASPKFLLGESYGGIRSAGLSGRLQDRYGMYLNGIVLVSAVIDFQTLITRGTNEVPYTLFLPTYATTAWYHKALSDEMQALSVEEVYAQAEEFAGGDYRDALFHGDSYPEEQRAAVVKRMSELTGLSTEYIEDANLRVRMHQFGKELLRDRGLVVGRYDSRYTGYDRNNVGEYTGHDPSGTAITGAFTSAMNDYLRDELEVEEERVYEILTGNVHPWDYSEFTNSFVDTSETLRQAMSDNPHLKVFAMCGYYDLATPVYAMKYSRNHLSLAPPLRENITLDYYEAGHMMYVHRPSLVKFKADLVEFYESTLALLDDDE